MKEQQFIRDVLAAAQAAGISQAEAYFQQSEALMALVYQGQINDYSVNTTGGLSLRGLVQGKMGFAYTEAFDEDAIGMLVRGVLESAALIEDEDEQFIFPGSPSYETVDSTGDLGTVEDRLAFALSLEKAGLAVDPRVLELGDYTGLASAHTTVRIANTRGLDLSHASDYCTAILQPVARDGEHVSSGWVMRTAHSLADLDAAALAREGVEEVASLLGAFPCDSGEMPVVFRNLAMANLLDAFSAIFSADAAQKDLSLLKDKEGQAIAAPCVTLVDDPLRGDGLSSCGFDAEGVAAYAKNVIDGGVLTTLLHNLKTAKKANRASTGNAARAGYAGAVTISPSNFFLAPGAQSADALDAAMGDGLVVLNMDGLHAGTNAVSGDFSLTAKGYLVRGGKRAHAVEQVTVAGNFFTLLQSIVALADDLRFNNSAFGSPSVWVKALSVAGK